MHGLTDFDLRVIFEVFGKFPEVQEAVLFGSRAKGTHKKGSDVDIALKGKNLQKIASDISGILNGSSPLPYYFDVLDYENIDNLDLKNHIDRVGVVIYRRSFANN